VIARHPSLDLALVKIEATDLPAIPVGDSDSGPSGAAGHRRRATRSASSGPSRSGSVVASGRRTPLLLTDVTLMPGNSGGPMVDARAG
jgi:serine protease Do